VTPGLAALLTAAGFAAGGVNAVAGGGSLISFPALLAGGVPSVPANVTNTVALWPGYVGGAIGYRRDVATQQRRRLAMYGSVGVLGAIVGAVVLLDTPARVFTSVVPWLVATGTLLFAGQPLVSRAVRTSAVRQGDSAAARVGVGLASVYGAYFGAGLGVMLLAVLALSIDGDLQELNAIKNTLSLVINTVALIAFALFGPVRWAAVLVMAIASLCGGYAGARVARRLSPVILRAAVTALGTGVSVTLFVKN